MNEIELGTKAINNILCVWQRQKVNYLDSDSRTHYQLSDRPSIEELYLIPLRFGLKGLDRNTPTMVYTSFPPHGIDLSEFTQDFTNIGFVHKDEYTNAAARKVEEYARAILRLY